MPCCSSLPSQLLYFATFSSSNSNVPTGAFDQPPIANCFFSPTSVPRLNWGFDRNWTDLVFIISDLHGLSRKRRRTLALDSQLHLQGPRGGCRECPGTNAAQGLSL